MANTHHSRSSDPVRILHVTDPHLFADPAEQLRGSVTHATLLQVLGHIRAAAWPADFVAVTGDLIQDDSAGAYERFRELFSPLQLPVHCVPGNHDVRDLMQKALASAPFHYCATVRLGDWLILGADSCCSDQAGGLIAQAEFERLEAEFRGSDAPHVLICLHHPPLPVGSRWLDSVGLDNGAELLAMCAASGRVRALLFGHVHQAFDVSHEGMRIIGTPSTCAQFRPASDEFALDDTPPAYRRVTLLHDGDVSSELIWLSAQR